MPYNYFKLDLDLSIARNDSEQFTGLKHSLYVESVEDANANLVIKFDSTSNKEVALETGTEIEIPESFSRVYITNDAAVGNAKLIFGHNFTIRKVHRITANIVQEGLLQQVITVAATATALPTTGLTDRVNLLIKNPAGGSTIYVGSSTVTASGAAQGIPIAAGEAISLEVRQGVTVYAIVAAATQDVNILEGA